MIDWLDGRKTYLLTAVAIAWELADVLDLLPARFSREARQAVLVLLGGSAFAALRAGVAKGEFPPSGGR